MSRKPERRDRVCTIIILSIKSNSSANTRHTTRPHYNIRDHQKTIP